MKESVMPASDRQRTVESVGLRTGIIGLGMLGGVVAASLAEVDVPMTVFDIRPDAFEKIAGIDGQAGTPAEVARDSDVVLIAVVDAEQAREVLSGPDGVLSAGARDLVVVLLSTLSLSSVRALAELCSEHGATLLDAGVTYVGGTKLVVMLGGDKEKVDLVLPVLESFARAVVYCGGLGAGMITKLARNMTTYGNWAVMREAVSLLVANGVDPTRLVEVMAAAGAEGPTPSSLLRMQLHRRNEGQQVPSEQVAYANGLAQKDLAAAQELAGASEVQTPIIDVARPTMKAVYSADFGTPLPEDRWQRGLEMMQRVYGNQLPDIPRNEDHPASIDMVEHVFGQVWGRGHLSLRDRRLLTLGATTMIGRQDLLEIQLRGALKNEEFTVAQLREMEYFLNYYVSLGNGSALLHAIEKLIAETASADQN